MIRCLPGLAVGAGDALHLLDSRFVFGLICMRSRAGRRLALPFAPFLCTGAVISLFFSNEIIRFICIVVDAALS